MLRYEKVLQDALQQEESKSNVSDPALSQAVSTDHRRSAMEAVKTLSDTWTARNPFEEQPFG